MARKVVFFLCAILALGGWAAAAISSLVQKVDADDLIAESIDISAVQIQQLNGSVTSHALVALLWAGLTTVPLFIFAVSAVIDRAMERYARDDPRSPPTATTDAP